VAWSDRPAPSHGLPLLLPASCAVLVSDLSPGPGCHSTSTVVELLRSDVPAWTCGSSWEMTYM
jgi:hypothetical protein